MIMVSDICQHGLTVPLGTNPYRIADYGSILIQFLVHNISMLNFGNKRSP
jgi:hypothetical protein